MRASKVSQVIEETQKTIKRKWKFIEGKERPIVYIGLLLAFFVIVGFIIMIDSGMEERYLLQMKFDSEKSFNSIYMALNDSSTKAQSVMDEEKVLNEISVIQSVYDKTISFFMLSEYLKYKLSHQDHIIVMHSHDLAWTFKEDVLLYDKCKQRTIWSICDNPVVFMPYDFTMSINEGKNVLFVNSEAKISFDRMRLEPHILNLAARASIKFDKPAIFKTKQGDYAIQADLNGRTIPMIRIPDDIKKLIGMGFSCKVVRGAGEKSGFSDAAYEKAGGPPKGGADRLSCWFWEPGPVIRRCLRPPGRMPARRRERGEALPVPDHGESLHRVHCTAKRKCRQIRSFDTQLLENPITDPGQGLPLGAGLQCSSTRVSSPMYSRPMEESRDRCLVTYPISMREFRFSSSSRKGMTQKSDPLMTLEMMPEHRVYPLSPTIRFSMVARSLVRMVRE